MAGNRQINIAASDALLGVVILCRNGVLVHGSNSMVKRLKLNVAVVGLTVNAVHNNMDRLVPVGSETSTAAEEGKYFSAGNIVGDLREEIVRIHSKSFECTKKC